MVELISVYPGLGVSLVVALFSVVGFLIYGIWHLANGTVQEMKKAVTDVGSKLNDTIDKIDLTISHIWRYTSRIDKQLTKLQAEHDLLCCAARKKVKQEEDDVVVERERASNGKNQRGSGPSNF